MMPSPPINDRTDTCHFRWLAAGSAQLAPICRIAPQSHRKSGRATWNPPTQHRSRTTMLRWQRHRLHRFGQTPLHPDTAAKSP